VTSRENNIFTTKIRFVCQNFAETFSALPYMAEAYSPALRSI